MTTYLTRVQAVALWGKTAPEFADGRGFDAALSAFTNAAIQAYRDSLVAGVVLPEPVGKVLLRQDEDGREPVMFYGGNSAPDANSFKDRFELVDVHTADQLRQAIADALAKQVPQGYKLVPVEPTPEMEDAAGHSVYGHPRSLAIEWAKEDKFESAAYVGCEAYLAMLKVAPAPKDTDAKA